MFSKEEGEKGYIRTTGGYVTTGGGKRRIFQHSVAKTYSLTTGAKGKFQH